MSKSFAYQVQLKSYVEAVQRNRIYQCDECDFAARKREEQKSHAETVHRDVAYQCDECDFAAVKREVLKTPQECRLSM